MEENLTLFSETELEMWLKVKNGSSGVARLATGEQRGHWSISLQVPFWFIKGYNFYFRDLAMAEMYAVKEEEEERMENT